MLNPSDISVRPTDLTERPAPQGSTGAPPLPEPTPTTMAERFAPTAQKLPADGPAPPLVDPALMPRLIAERARASSAGKWLLIAAILVSLVPTAVILVLLWQGVIAIPRSGDVQSRADPEPLAATQQATVAPAPAVLLGAKPEIALTVPGQIAAKSGDEIAFTISIDSDETLPARSVIAIRAMPEGATFSQGRPYGTAEWNLTPDEIGDLKLKLPETASGGADMRVELMAADGAILASALTRLDIAPDPRADLILRSDESGRIADLIALGHKMIDVGYFAGARAYFKRAAEAGSGDAALLLGATFDPEFIAKIGAQGIKADPKEARGWYERAEQLGVKDAESKLKALKEDVTNRQQPVQATETLEAPAETAPNLAVIEPAPNLAANEPAATAEEAAEQPVAAEAASSSPEAEASLPADQNEWVELVSYANVRAAPSSTAETLRVAEKGTKLRVTARKGNWVEVIDPATSDVGWVYARYIETAQAPAR